MAKSKRTERRRTSSASATLSRRGAPVAGGFISALVHQGLSTLREQVGTQAGNVTDVIRDQGGRYLADRKSWAADEIATVGDAIRLAADKLHDRHIDSLAGYVGTAAKRVDGIARIVREREIGELGRDIEQFARRRPVIALSGLFLAGLAAGRFMRANRPARQ